MIISFLILSPDLHGQFLCHAGLGFGLTDPTDNIVVKSIFEPENQKKKYHYFENPAVCSGCHWDRFETWSSSQHAKGFTGDFFQAQFYKNVLPSRSLGPEVANAHKDCIGCHSPTAFLSGDMKPQASLRTDNHWDPLEEYHTQAERGITCQSCLMQPMEGKPAKMGFIRPHNTDHWFVGQDPYEMVGNPMLDPKINNQAGCQKIYKYRQGF